MGNYVVKTATILFLTVFGLLTSHAQVLLPTTEDRPEKIQSHQDKGNYLQRTKAKIELKMVRTRQDTLPSDDRKLLLDPTVKKSKLKTREIDRKAKTKKVKSPE